MSDYASDIRRYSNEVDDKALAAIVKYCGIALRNADSALVSGSDPKELETVRKGFASKKLELSAEAADAAIKTVVAKMSDTPRKSRVTFYYLLAQASGTIDKLR